MGGSIGKGNITPAAQFNVYFDPFAAKGVLESKGDVPLTMIPLDLTHDVVAHNDVFEELKNQKKPFGDAIYQMLKQYQQMYWKAYGEDQFPWPPVHDPAVIFYILEPKYF